MSQALHRAGYNFHTTLMRNPFIQGLERVKKEGNEYVAHCLELDIVTTAPDLNQIHDDMADLIIAQINYAFSNDNLDNLFHPAPSEVWQEFFKCKAGVPKRRELKSKPGLQNMVPPWIIANTCVSDSNCFVS